MNYTQSVTLLKQRFGQPEKLINAHTHALIELPGPTNELSSLQLFHDITENHIRGLASLGVSKESYSTILVPIILGKLPIPVRRNLARDHDQLRWTLDDLQTAVVKEIRVLESALYTTDSPPSSSTRTHATASFHAAIRGGRHPTGSSKKKAQCVYCKGEHSPTTCSEVTDYQKRLDIARKANLCFNCLGNHRISQCHSKFRCKLCKHKHHTSLCKPTESDIPKPSKQETEQPPSQPPAQQVNANTAPVLHGVHYNKEIPLTTVTLLKTAVAPVIGEGIRIQGNILFDEGSQRSFITLETATKLKLRPVTTENVAIAPFGAEYSSPQPIPVGQVKVETTSGDKVPISVLTVPFIAAPLKNSVRTSIESFPHLRGLKLAHPITNEHNFHISILIGADYYWSFVEDKIIRGEGPTAQQSKLGFLLSGPISPPTPNLHVATMSIATSEELNLERFWSIEEAGTSPTLTDNAFIHHYQTTCIRQDSDGTYTAQFPWKPVHPPLPPNLMTCEKRTRQLISRLADSPSLLHLYHSIITDQETRGFIEKVKSTGQPPNVHYLPHHPVKKESATTPIRIVYDCSSRQSTTHTSLNDCLQVGPPFLNDLCSILLRFRTHTFAFTADIEKAFLHVKLHESDRDSTRFLWLSDLNNPFGALTTYRFKVVPFGTSSSPFMLNATLDLHLKKFPSSVAKDMSSNLYVDNLISGCDSEQQLMDYYTQSRCIMNQAKFNLRSWSSNSQRLRARAERDQTSDSSTCVNLLGLRWNTLDDKLGFIPKRFPSLTSSPLTTTRDILRDSAQIYDPLGLLTPITVKAKLLLQALWKKKVDWDEPVDQETRDDWQHIASDIQEVTTYVYPRCYFTRPFRLITTKQLHVFADASLCAYGAVAYLVDKQRDQTTLVMSRSRVAPVRSITLPKLELMAAVIATRVASFFIQSLHLTSNDTTIHLWSDRQITLHWIYDIKQTATTKPFIANRVMEITQTFPASVWTYVPTDDNPADLLTRGISAEQLKSSQLWLYGPSWLISTDQWPTWSPASVLHLQNIAIEETQETNDERVINPANTSGIHLVIDAYRYSRLTKLLKVTVYVHRLCHNLKHPLDKITGPVTAKELSDATMLWIKTSQQLEYFKEIANLTSKPAKRTLLVHQLKLFLDSRGFLCCGGRIHNAPISELAKFPYLLSPKHPITKLLVYATHERLHHAGVSSMITAIRQLYWIPAIRVYVKKLLRKCVTCVRLTGKPYRPPDPPPLPKARIEDPTPFSVCGVDFTGAMYICEADYGASDAQMRKRLTNHARLLLHFQNRWKREYLTSLREFHKASGMNMQNVEVGDMVLIHDDGPRLQWRLGIVDSLLQGNDGLVRAVNVRTNNRITSRPISRLYPLEVSLPSDNQTECSNSTEIATNSTKDETGDRPQWAAAKRARARLLEWTTRLTRPPEDVEN